MSFSFNDQAELEFLEAIDYFEGRAEGLGMDFTRGFCCDPGNSIFSRCMAVSQPWAAAELHPSLSIRPNIRGMRGRGFHLGRDAPKPQT